MSADLVLLRSEAGESLTKTSVGAAAAALSRKSTLKMSLAPEGDALQVRLHLPAGDEGCAAVAVRFAKNGRSLSGTARGRGEVLLYWCFLALANELRCELEDPQAGGGARVDPADVERKARRVVEEHEEEVLEERAEEEDEDGEDDEPAEDEDHDATVVGLVAMMVEEGTIALPSGRRPASSLVRLQALLDDPSALYEAILEADEIDEVFVSESEFVTVVRRYRVKAAAS